jgi:hypothetical protein
MNYVFIASKAKDIIKEKGKIVDVVDGGPGKYIEKVAKKSDINYSLYDGDEYQVVEIEVLDGEEFGKADKISEIKLPEIPKDSHILISTVGDEFNLKDIPFTSGIIGLDIQGYVRGKDFNIKKRFEFEEVLEKITILKGTKQELEYVNHANIPIVIKTNGANPGEILFKDETIEFKPKKIFAKNTIGAGDTFFSKFFIIYTQTKNISKSLSEAINCVEDFLKEK